MDFRDFDYSVVIRRSLEEGEDGSEQDGFVEVEFGRFLTQTSAIEYMDIVCVMVARGSTVSEVKVICRSTGEVIKKKVLG